MDCSTPGFPVLHYLPEFAQTLSIKSVMPSNHLILCRPLLLLPSIFPSIRVFSNQSAFCIRWPKYWSFSFSISPSSEYSRFISSKIDLFDILKTSCPGSITVVGLPCGTGIWLMIQLEVEAPHVTKNCICLSMGFEPTDTN